MTERSVVDEDVIRRDAFVFQILLKDLVGRPRIDIICTEECKFLDAKLFEIIVSCRYSLLVRCSTRVEDVFRAFFALILDRVEKKAVQLLNHRQNGFARYRCPVTEYYINFVNREKLACFFSEQRPIGSRVNNNRDNLFTQKAAFCVLLFNQHQHGIFQGRL